MPLPIAAAVTAKIAAKLPLLMKVPGALKALYASKYFWPALLGGTFFGQEALSQIGKRGERKLSREELALQQILSEASAEATKRATKESRERTGEYVKELTKARREESKQAREAALMESFITSQDRQMALVLNAIQGVTQSVPTTGVRPVGAGMTGLMRSNI
jgi:hypothetical protein